ncbi:dTDP-4-dehydrorhamnose 3,5-epimerase family protein [Sphaerotilus microaerophilus]|uniref:dTDP-4-dehydrorhamnose 3,5-epimerase n=1 Tax=Sphaerotilus microaerophilus TaxID=2914710 RepID=A0ABM7YQL5_9BURK|nr:dTDP-4-dehydrorhamnose 3,5-epimerase family protein [Sphaerotilus sp. FB-5]BDI06858.1 dTDP-4-dehydrorhamnose 3,5-epimerase [Sphaerotilus sp. FB-5]
MKFVDLPVVGAKHVQAEPVRDERGAFARLWCRDEFARAGLPGELAQTSASFNTLAGTLRGLHFTWPPSGEGKLVRCARGRLHDLLLDLRPDSPSFGVHCAVVLDADERHAVWIPPGVAHGFQTLVDATEVHYSMNEPYRPELADGYRHDDPAFVALGLAWPLPVSCIGARDREWPAFDVQRHRQRWAAAQQGAR